MQPLVITYLTHSGFTVQLGDVLLVFDYWRGEHGQLPISQQLDSQKFLRFRQVYVFISHTHPDHFDQIVFTWRKEAQVSYIVSDDMPVGMPGKRMKPGDQLAFYNGVACPISDTGKRGVPDIMVQAFDSTDTGVSFLVALGRYRIFHAGDLNFWHWRDESTPAQVQAAEVDFHRAVAPIIGRDIHVAFFPLDPRQGSMFDIGANYFIMQVKPRLFIPMHFWNRLEAAELFSQTAGTPDTTVLPLYYPGDQLTLTMDEDDNLNVSVDGGKYPPERPLVKPQIHLPPEDDPFRDTDLPVDI